MRWKYGQTALLTLALGIASAVGCGPAQSSGQRDQLPGGGGGPTGTGGGIGAGTGGGGTGNKNDLFALEPNQPMSAEAQGTGAAAPTNVGCPAYDPSAKVHDFNFTVADSGSMAAAARTREVLKNGKAPTPTSIRTSDFLNYYAPTAKNLAPADGLLAKFELRKRVIDGVAIPTQFDLFVGVQAGPVTRPRVALTLLVDATLTDESLARAKAVVTALGKGLVAGDHVTLMSTDAAQPVHELDLVTPTTELADLAEQIQVGAGTVAERLAAAIQKATEANQPGNWNRVVVLGDGEESPDGPDYSLLETTALNSKIYLTAVGLSPESTYGDYLLYRLSRNGRGRYVYIDDVTEADALFPARFDELFGVARESVRAQVKLPWFMYSLDPEVPPSTSDHSVYLAPGGVMRFVFRVGACSPTIVETDGWETIGLMVTSVLPGGQAAPDFPHAKEVKKLLLDPAGTPELDKLLATQAFVDALRYPVDSRFAVADALLGNQNTSPFTDLLALLAQHPNHPKP